MRRKIIRIDAAKCNGCGQCVDACVEGAIELVDGKARLVSDVYCDGLGACIGECPTGALTIEEREAPVFDEEAVRLRAAQQEPAGCPGARLLSGKGCPGSALRAFPRSESRAEGAEGGAPTSLSQWPVQLMLVPPHAPFLHKAHLLISADCVPFAIADFHERYLEGRAVLVGCPKLDDLEHYAEKLRSIIRISQPSSITVLRMEVPCCGGIARVTRDARNEVSPDIPLEIHTVGIDGSISAEVIPAPAVGSAADADGNLT